MAGALVASVALAGGASAASGPDLLSVTTTGASANELSPQTTLSLSADGSKAVFVSASGSLVAGDTNGVKDVFLRNLDSGATRRVSVSSSEVQGDGASSNAMISADGRYVVFTSSATSLVAGDTNGVADVFVRDLATGATDRITDGNAASGDVPSSISADGSFVTFASSASNLVAGDSDGVRGIRLAKGDEIISMAILNHFDATAEERVAYLKQANALRRSDEVEDAEVVSSDADAEAEEVVAADVTISQERFSEMQAAEQFVLTVSSKGFGKRSSSFEFRTSGRGGKGIVAMVVNDRNGRLVASFPIAENDQIMLVTNAGQLIRCPVHDIRIAGRNTQGVRIFKTEAEEKVVSVERITDDNGTDEAVVEATAIE